MTPLPKNYLLVIYALFKHCLNNLELPYQLVKTTLGPLLFDLIHVNYFNIIHNVWHYFFYVSLKKIPKKLHNYLHLSLIGFPSKKTRQIHLLYVIVYLNMQNIYWESLWNIVPTFQFWLSLYILEICFLMFLNNLNIHLYVVVLL
jgi:hypothetical protein